MDPQSPEWSGVFYFQHPVECTRLVDESACRGADKCLWSEKNKCEAGFERPPKRYVFSVIDPKSKLSADLRVCGKGQSRHCDKWMIEKVNDCSGRFYIFHKDRIFGKRYLFVPPKGKELRTRLDATDELKPTWRGLFHIEPQEDRTVKIFVVDTPSGQRLFGEIPRLDFSNKQHKGHVGEGLSWESNFHIVSMDVTTTTQKPTEKPKEGPRPATTRRSVPSKSPQICPTVSHRRSHPLTRSPSSTPTKSPYRTIQLRLAHLVSQQTPDAYQTSRRGR
eukprot:TRINITY_DN602_c0_g1_i5.p1 TRINITY_DN602_c0_g1~~TRINITY_DN602_c0_g1_i5.p1  ORF type:complete len:277 (+),score=31.83 TRINITY_DN602_c0_g1_i5:155-985(+)